MPVVRCLRKNSISVVFQRVEKFNFKNAPRYHLHFFKNGETAFLFLMD